MQYFFDEIVSRENNNSAKYEESVLHYGTNDLIPLWIADMDFKTCPEIVAAIKERADQGIFGYTYRTPKYFQAIADWQTRRNGYTPKTTHMAFTPGVIPGMRILLQMITKPQDKVVISQPVYHPFADIVKNTGRTLVVNPLIQVDGKWQMDFEDFESKLKDASLFILCNPHNPVGRVWTVEELSKIAELCLRYHVPVFSDEIHADLMLNGSKHTCFASLSPEVEAITTTFTSSSKTFNLAGLQAATMIFPTVEGKDAYVAQLRLMDIARNNCFSMEATMAAIRYGEEWLEQLTDYIADNLKFIVDFFEAHIPQLKTYVPEATYLAWVDARALGLSDEELIPFFAEHAKVGLTGGTEFGIGGSGYFRLNAACPRATLEKALASMEKAVKERK
ncbi:MAG: MalY/PatB family protein [Ndongobacter sp.]|nr:MalY/PatB family protein [Ndongobacter sp.]